MGISCSFLLLFATTQSDSSAAILQPKLFYQLLPREFTRRIEEREIYKVDATEHDEMTKLVFLHWRATSHWSNRGLIAPAQYRDVRVNPHLN